MKVLHINSYYLIRPLHQNMMEHLDKTGVKNDVMAHCSKEEIPVIQPNKNVHVMRCFQKADKPFFFIKQYKVMRSAEREFDFTQYDLTHSYSLFSSGYCSYKIKKKYGIPYVVAIRDTDINVFLRYKPYLKRLGTEILREASKIFFLSVPYQRKVLDTLIPINEKVQFLEKCEIIPNGIDDFWLNNKVNEQNINTPIDNRIHLLYVGELTRRKNVSALLDAVTILRKQGVNTQLTVIGKRTDESIFERVMCEKEVIYHEPMAKEELIKYYRDNDLFVLPSLTETFGLVYAEAMSQGLPVLYTKGQGFDGQFEEGLVGHSIDCNNPQDIAQKVLLAYKNKQKLSLNCITSVDKFSWDTITLRYAQLYEDIIHNK